MRKGFVFDLDGVITNTAKYHFIAWKNLASKIGIEIDYDFNEKIKGVSRMESLEYILRYGGRENDFTDEDKKELATEKNREYLGYLDMLSTKDILPGALDFLSETKSRKIPSSLASTSKSARFIIEKLNLIGYFDAVVDPETIKKGKPDPEIYIKGAEAIKLKPKECVGFEDSQVGIDSIKRSGMYAVGIVRGKELIGTDISVKSLKDLTIDELLVK